MTKPKAITMDTMLKGMPVTAPPQDRKDFEDLLEATESDLEAGSAMAYVRVKMGRPKKAEASAPSVVKAVRLPLALLEALQDSARLQGLSLNAVLQIASAEWLMHHKRS